MHVVIYQMQFEMIRDALHFSLGARHFKSVRNQFLCLESSSTSQNEMYPQGFLARARKMHEGCIFTAYGIFLFPSPSH
uniref:Uncharacterized protein n=1 Tax=Anguilla anguilla TaxID=7936 RepID=A0A0E9RGU1_ANGAN